MIAVVSVLFILAVSLLITRIATVALQLTGLSKANARFQARSAFTGVGYTTSEAEHTVNHPVRRRIVMLLMLLGNVGLVSVMSIGGSAHSFRGRLLGGRTSTRATMPTYFISLTATG
jgi:Trk-type K+ transport system membrane component